MITRQFTHDGGADGGIGARRIKKCDDCSSSPILLLVVDAPLAMVFLLSEGNAFPFHDEKTL